MINWEPTKTPPPPLPQKKKKKTEIIQILSPIKLYALFDIKVIACLKPGIIAAEHLIRIKSFDGCSLVSRKLGSTK